MRYQEGERIEVTIDRISHAGNYIADGSDTIIVRSPPGMSINVGETYSAKVSDIQGNVAKVITREQIEEERTSAYDSSTREEKVSNGASAQNSKHGTGGSNPFTSSTVESKSDLLRNNDH